MLYETPQGKTIDIPVSLFLSLTDDEFDHELEQLIAGDFGEDVMDIWKGSILKDHIPDPDDVVYDDPLDIDPSLLD